MHASYSSCTEVTHNMTRTCMPVLHGAAVQSAELKLSTYANRNQPCIGTQIDVTLPCIYQSCTARWPADHECIIMPTCPSHHAFCQYELPTIHACLTHALDGDQATHHASCLLSMNMHGWSSVSWQMSCQYEHGGIDHTWMGKHTGMNIQSMIMLTMYVQYESGGSISGHVPGWSCPTCPQYEWSYFRVVLRALLACNC